MISRIINRFLSAIGTAGLSLAFAAPLVAQNAPADPFALDFQRALERQMERFSRMLPNDPAAREQFSKGLEEMKKAFEEDDANPSNNGQPRTFEFHWEGDAGDLSDLRMEFERRGSLFGEDLFDQFFRGRRGSSPGFRLHPFDMQGWFDSEAAEIPELSKNHPDELKNFRPVVAEARKSTARILIDGNPIALGTIVSENGYALTKRSELGRYPHVFEARLADGRSVGARVVDEVSDYDLALVKLDATGLTPAKLVETDLPVGSFLAASNTTEEPAAIGILSVLARNMSSKSKGYLGIGVESADGNVAVRSVTQGSAAAAAGLLPSDVITEIDGEKVRSAAQLINSVSSRQPDEIVEISYLRNGRAAKTSARLRSRAELNQELTKNGLTLDRDAFDLTNRMGANLSRQRGGYPSAIQHDLPLAPHQMGGPLCDLDGNIVGINIARAGRVSTYALPAAEVIRILAAFDLDSRSDHLPEDQKHEPSPAQNKHALREEVARAEKAIEAARRALRAAEDSARAAREALIDQE